eukprot:s706_g28.t1
MDQRLPEHNTRAIQLEVSMSSECVPTAGFRGAQSLHSWQPRITALLQLKLLPAGRSNDPYWEELSRKSSVPGNEAWHWQIPPMIKVRISIAMSKYQRVAPRIQAHLCPYRSARSGLAIALVLVIPFGEGRSPKCYPRVVRLVRWKVWVGMNGSSCQVSRVRVSLV